MKTKSFIFRTIQGFIFGAIAGFVLRTIAHFVVLAINLLYNYGRKYLLQINVKLKEIVIYIDRSYSHYIYFYQCFYYKC